MSERCSACGNVSPSTEVCPVCQCDVPHCHEYGRYIQEQSKVVPMRRCGEHRLDYIEWEDQGEIDG